MPFKTKKTAAMKVGGRRRVKYARRKFMLQRGLATSRTFVETFRAPSPTGVGFFQIVQNNGGLFDVTYNMLPQAAQYSSLYRSFAIKKLEVILIPRYTEVDMNTALGGINNYAPRIAWSVNDTPYQDVPVSEQDVLEDNGGKVAVLNKKLVLTCYPKPSLAAQSQNNALAAFRTRKLVWLNSGAIDNELLTNGVNVSHGSIAFWCAGNPANAQTPIADVYYRLTFAMRDPA